MSLLPTPGPVDTHGSSMISQSCTTFTLSFSDVFTSVLLAVISLCELLSDSSSHIFTNIIIY